MRFLSVADRELRAAARQKATYRTRWITAGVFFALLVWLLWAFNGFRNRRVASEVFEVFSVLTFVYCLITGTARTADCISSERREGTLGLLFLTNLNSAEIIAGKLCSSALASVYALFAIFPMLALPLLMGGITFEHFARTVLALLGSILFSLAAGFVASVVCARQFTAIALSMGLAIFVGGGFMIAGALAYSYRLTRPLADWLAVSSPLYTLLSADGARVFGINRYWYSVVTVVCMSLAWLGLTTLWLARTWRDRPKAVRAWNRIKFSKGWNQPASARRVALRRRLLDINPFFWLGGRKPVSAPGFMFISALLVVITVYVTAPFFGRVLRAGTFSPMIGFLFAWVWTGLAIHALVLYYAAMVASQRLAEDKQAGALELILSTPTTERSISRGLWMAYARRMFFPALLAVLVHSFFIWLCMTMATLDPPGSLPPGATPGEVFWSALLDTPLRGHVLEWHFGFMLRIALLLLVLLMAIWLTLGWVGRWLGLRLKHPGFAPMTSLALVIVPPVILFSLACYLADEWKLDRLPDRKFLPAMMWLAFAIGIGHCVLISAWASQRLRRDFRTIVTSRFQPPSLRRWWRPSRRSVLRFAAGTASLAAALALIIASFYGYQNWRSKRAWTVFQKQLKQKGESLDVSALLPGPVPDHENFARTPVFLSLVNRKDAETARLFDSLRQFDTPNTPYMNSPATVEWMKEGFAPLDDYVKRLAPKKSRAITSTNPADYATAILQGLQSQRDTLDDAATGAQLAFFQTSTNRDARAVLHPNQNELLALERLQLLFQVRACALLGLDRAAEASEDLLTGLRLARLARQSPDARSSIRVHFMIMRCLQPLWEGLTDAQWNEMQLAAFQKQLAEFNLLADHTNAIRRAVLANIEMWRAIPNAEPNRALAVQPNEESIRQLQPRAWWFDSCIQLHRAGEKAIENVDVAGGRVRVDFNWGDLSDLPLANETSQLFQQYYWSGPSPALVSFAQNAVNQAIIACALERFLMANNKYPETLEQLVPFHLDRIPNDVIRGRPMIYDQAHGRYILRGVGPNETDDRNKKGPVVTPPVSDDWLWSYGTNAPAAPR